MSKPIIQLKNIDFDFKQIKILEGINLEVNQKDFLAVIGPNGSGKTTLIKIILGLIKPTKGQVKVFGQGPQKVNQKMGYLPQGDNFDLDFPLTVEEVVLYGFIKPNSFGFKFKSEEKAKAKEIMQKIGIFQKRKNLIGQLSGGEKQKVLISRAMSANPQILILDEPNAHIDSRSEKDLYHLLKSLNQEMTIIMVSHDISAVSKYANKVACVNKNLYLSQIKDLKAGFKKHNHEHHFEDFIPIKHRCKL
jgi:zinc transport system ATP-binding protein